MCLIPKNFNPTNARFFLLWCEVSSPPPLSLSYLRGVSYSCSKLRGRVPDPPPDSLPEAVSGRFKSPTGEAAPNSQSSLGTAEACTLWLSLNVSPPS